MVGGPLTESRPLQLALVNSHSASSCVVSTVVSRSQ
jgi:hypothetical protein